MPRWIGGYRTDRDEARGDSSENLGGKKVFGVDGIESWKKLTKEEVEGACPLIGRSRLVS
jgi:hypothetical protein